jgi:cellulose synthase/poly-beta-1,6-N-acetylglucosamine synthase-like glycosyltransferase/peptidoglycan/xylan/chitin deacetylase (PgdA/CDA1 family)/spore germination protein YaaH
MTRPVFHDPTGRRGRWTGWSLAFLVLLVVGAVSALAFTIVDMPVPPPLPFRMEQARLHALAERIGAAQHGNGAHMPGQSWLPKHALAAANGNQLVTGFYVPWDDTSRASFAAHAGQMDWVMPAIASVTGPDHRFAVTPDPRFDAILAATRHKPAVLPMVQNAAGSAWDGPGLAALLHDPAASARLLTQVEALVAAKHGAGVTFDFEELPRSAQGDYLRFLDAANRRFGLHGWIVTAAVPVGDPDWNLAAYARVTDRLFLMLYDEHWATGDPGPIASQAWFLQRLQEAIRQIGPDHAIAAIANYGYDWTPGRPAEALSVEEAWLSARDSQAPIRFDAASGNVTFDYDEDGAPHHVWLLDAASAWNQLRVAHVEGVAGVALWRLGSEDPGLWRAFAAFTRQNAPPDLAAISSSTNVDVEGNGEILRIAATPTLGHRTIGADATGLIRSENYDTLPSPYVVQRTGYRPGLVALTFDDGPDPDWTPGILDILREKHVPATFFVIGENVLGEQGLLQRIVAEGHELGNHSYTHPNFATLSDGEAIFELNTTERLIEAYTGRRTRLFRAPYFGDAEPTTADELGPALAAQRDGYVNVGLHVDPDDWALPGTDAIVQRTVAGVEAANADRSGQIVLLHDGGGDRQQTLEALPRIIDQLRARGYRFVPVSQLAGFSHQEVMPVIEGGDLVAVRIDVGIFMALAWLNRLLAMLFTLAIVLGLARAITLTALAARSRPEEAPALPEGPGRLISVLIPAWNEAKVIEASVRRVLASEAARLEVIVIDDGSTDGTSAIVSAAFAQDRRVRLLTLANGGKAAALNRGIALAKGDIIVALDADTQFEPLTIARLARWFANPRIGAVAGTAKVGNKVNLVTRWQAIEYVTAQNLERRAMARLDAITVVPGAVGAWRRQALEDVGGFPIDTLAEDQDLTIAIQRAGWRIANDVEAVAWTESPQSLRALAKQRFRWAFGTLQCLWKHRRALREGRPRGLARIGMPQAWLFQVLFSLVSPMIDLALLFSIVMTWGRVSQHGWAQTHSDLGKMAFFWLLFVTVDLICGWIAFRMDKREKRFPGLLLIAQRFVYRQLMYWVVLKAVSAALRGHWVGWGKLERTGRTTAPVTT